MTVKKKSKLSVKSHKTKQAKSYKAAIRRARPRHRKIMLHPATIMTLLCIGVLIVNFTRSSSADNLVVSAVVPVAPLTEGAIITNPFADELITSSPIETTGSCPDNSYVNLYNNGIFVGSAACVAQTFSIETGLYSGTNDLLAKDFNSTDDSGPTTPDVYVTYSPQSSQLVPPSQVKQLLSNATPETGTNTATEPQTNGQSLPLLLSANYTFKAFLPSTDFTWQIDLSGGTPPYLATVNWGDGTSTNYKFNVDPLFTVSHRYTNAGYYPVVVHSVDSDGRQTYLQLAALIHTSNSVGFAGITEKKSPPPAKSGTTLVDKVHSLIWVIWPAYSLILLLIFSFWLGERQEYMRLISDRQARKRRHSKAHY